MALKFEGAKGQKVRLQQKTMKVQEDTDDDHVLMVLITGGAGCARTAGSSWKAGGTKSITRGCDSERR